MERLNGRELDIAIGRLRGWQWRRWEDGSTPAFYPPEHPMRQGVILVEAPASFSEWQLTSLPEYSSDPAAAMELLAWAVQQEWVVDFINYSGTDIEEDTFQEVRVIEPFMVIFRERENKVRHRRPTRVSDTGKTLPEAIAQAVYAALSARQGAREEE